MIKIYGSMLCPDCVACRKDLDEAGVAYEYLDFSADLKNLKEFLKIRDGNPLFDELRAEGKIGIPCNSRDDFNVLLSIFVVWLLSIRLCAK